MTDFLLTPQRKPDDADAAMRPKKLAGFVGRCSLGATLEPG